MVECGSSFAPTTKGFAALFHLFLSKDPIAEAFAHYDEMPRFWRLSARSAGILPAK
ncbi:MAG: hypothetical protein PHU14_01930 [Methylovulum sp.]|nr:hypothetical protein [Methylovulum sp.]